MIIFKIEPITFKTVSGLEAKVTGLAPGKKECQLIGVVIVNDEPRAIKWHLNGTEIDEQNEGLNLVDDNDVSFRELAYFSQQLCPG